MSLKSILVYVDETRGAAGAMQAACALARRHEAHLIGLAEDGAPNIPGYASIEIPQTILEMLKAQRVEALAKLRETFDTAVAKAGLTNHSEWTAVRGSRLDSLAVRSRYVDLTVLAQPDPRQGSPVGDLVDEFLLASGRPALVIPYIGAPAPIGKTVLIAWDAGREAARAVADAIPLLDQADRVEILAVEPRGIGDSPGADIARQLARHGIKAEARAVSGLDVGVGDAILNRAADIGADLIVMGAYGHSRMRELVMGGATRHISEHMTIPVLFSH